MSETSVSLTAGLVLPMMVGAMIVFGEDFYPWVLPAGFFAAFFMAVEAAGGEVLSLTLSSNAPFVGLFLLADPGIRPAHRVGMALFGVFAGLAAGLLLVSSATMLPVVAGTLIACTFRPLIDRALVRRTWR
jgi:Na+-translocating ferredoxin:NAD+ oxidoreductase RnfD subunit